MKGTFYTKVYPLARMSQWHKHGWRKEEHDLPAFAAIFRITADSLEFNDPASRVEVRQPPLRPYRVGLIELDRMEFEASGMGTGKKCLRPGQSTPAHSTRRYQELLFGLEGQLTVRLGNDPQGLTLGPSQALYIPPQTRHELVNQSDGDSCYIFVFSQPVGAPATVTNTSKTVGHGH